MKALELYPEIREERRCGSLHFNYGYYCCNEWLCPFNNNGICVCTEVDCLYDESFKNDLEILYKLSSSYDEDEINPAFEAWREMMVERYK